jgi:hypothetical protein
MSRTTDPTAVPSTPVAEAAASLAAEACPPFLLRHSYRTYLFGRALVVEDLDQEAAFVASMLHDIGLTDEHLGDTSFEVVGAEIAARFLEERGWDRDRIRLVEHAIIRHVELGPIDVPELRVVQAGAALDVAGLSLDDVRAEDLRDILRAHPRETMAQEIREAFLAEVRRQPEGAFAQLEATVSLSDVMLRNPLDT